MRAHRYWSILCCEGDQQAADGWAGTYGIALHIQLGWLRTNAKGIGPERDCDFEEGFYGAPEYFDAGGLLRDDE